MKRAQPGKALFVYFSKKKIENFLHTIFSEFVEKHHKAILRLTLCT